ncbi:lysozyme [Brevundimonas albigilva]|jgi:lysozyme|uniref:Lysozyme n=1 Tax=Brevundimonas albigilva TaxID=1312364 RepID=A0ABY4SPT8_9CAUL|nr:lysozyme [Brevundimonas albigilva]URI15919.1 lysozyme [Brevundimonas albigilva]
MRPIPDRAASFIARHESLRLVAYDDLNPNRRSFASVADVKGKATIGWGHTATVSPQDVVDRRRITQAEARALLLQDLNEARRKLYQVVKSPVIDSLTENQYAAILSFVFNLGANPGWTIWKRLNARQYDQVPAQMARFVNARVNGKLKKLDGLVERRNAEIALWSTAEPGSLAESPPSSVTRAIPTPPTPVEAKPLVQSNTAITAATQVVTGVSAGAVAIQQTVAPQAMQAEVLQKLVSILAIVITVCGVLLLVFQWMKRREAKR